MNHSRIYIVVRILCLLALLFPLTVLPAGAWVTIGPDWAGDDTTMSLNLGETFNPFAEDALFRWNVVPGHTFMFFFNNENHDRCDRGFACIGTDGNAVEFENFANGVCDDAASTALAVTRLNWIIDFCNADVLFNDQFTWTNDPRECTTGSPYNLNTVAIHEFGHALGLDHEDDELATMNSIYHASAHLIHGDDHEGIRAIYDADGGVVNIAPSHWKKTSTSPNQSAVVVTPTSASANAGDSVTFEWTQENMGTSTANFNIGFFLSTNSTISTSDTLLGVNVGAFVTEGFAGTHTRSLTIPCGTATGTYWIGNVLDHDNALAETSDNDNDFEPCQSIFVFNELPLANAGTDRTVECTGPAGAPVTLNGSASFDPCGSSITYTWSGPFPEGGGTVSGVSPTVTLPLGVSIITLVVNDGLQNSSPDTVVVAVVDTIPPTLACPASLDLLGANCRGFADVPLDSITAADICGLASLEATPPDVSCGTLETVLITATDVGNNAINCDIPVSVECRDPLNQGYWFRQCIGSGLITPGRSGRGPQEPLDPDFLKVLVPAVDQRLQDTVFEFGGTCQGGMDASPPSDACERAVRSYTALLLNLASVRLHEDCVINLGPQGCVSGTVGDLVNELAVLINSGDADNCRQASTCADSVTGHPGDGGGGGGSSSSTPAQGAASTDATESATGSEKTGGVTSPAEDPKAPTLAPSLSTETRRVANRQEVSAGVETSQPSGTQATPVLLVEEPARVGSPETAGAAEVDKTKGREAIDRHLAVIADTSAPRESRQASEEALLTALGGGYGPEIRLKMVRGLLGKVDVAYESLLAKYLEDIRNVARETGNKKVANEAARLLKSLLPSEESAE